MTLQLVQLRKIKILKTITSQTERAELKKKVETIIPRTLIPPLSFLGARIVQEKWGIIVPMEGKSGRKSCDFRIFFFGFSDYTPLYPQIFGGGIMCVIWGYNVSFGGIMCHLGGTVCHSGVQCVIWEAQCVIRGYNVSLVVN